MKLKSLFIPNSRNNYEAILLKKWMLLLYTLIFFVINYIPGIFPQSFSHVSAGSISNDKLIELTNADRKKFGLSELKGNAQLTSAAYAKANDILQKQYWDHYGPNGETPWQFIRGAGYDYIFAGENLAKGFRTAEGVHQAWMASPTHRDNILSGEYKDIGIAVVDGKLLDENVVLVVQMFGNLTDEVEKPDIDLSDEDFTNTSGESGDIKSIKITSPKRGQVVTDPKLTVEGKATGFSADDFKAKNYEVSVKEGGDLLGTTALRSNKWSVQGTHDWTQGSHEIEATLMAEGTPYKDALAFSVDSVPPVVFANSVSVEADAGTVKISVVVQDESPDVSFVTNEVYTFAAGDNGKFEVKVPIKKLGEKAEILASDSYGNSTAVDIADKLVAYRQHGVDLSPMGFLRSIAGKLPSMTPKDWINTTLVLFVLVLLIMEIYYYWKHGKLLQRMYSFFIVGIWVVLLVARVVVGFGSYYGMESLSMTGVNSQQEMK